MTDIAMISRTDEPMEGVVLMCMTMLDGQVPLGPVHMGR